MFRKILHTAFLITIVGQLNAFATSTVMQGNAIYYRGKTLELHSYSDLFTFSTRKISSTQVGTDGNFQIEIEVGETGLYVLIIERVHAHIFIQPGNQYTIVLPEPEGEDKLNPAKDVFVMPEIFEAKGKLNHDITSVEKTINQFLIDHLQYYGRGVSRMILAPADSLIAYLKAKHDKNQDPYFQEYLHYRLASFELQTNHSRNKVFEAYFQGRSPAYKQLSFANAFTLFYESYFTYLNPVRAQRFQPHADTAINTSNLTMLLKCMEIDPHLANQEIRELLAVWQLYELAITKKYPIENVLSMLDGIILSAKNENCKIIAANAQSKITRLAIGTKAPEVEFADVMGNIYRLSEYRGRLIYIQFFDDFNPETLKEMSMMKVLHKSYGSEIAMFSISTSESLKQIRETSKNYGFDWFFGKAHMPASTIADYDLRALPAYFLIDSELFFVKSPAPPPGAKIEKLFAKVWTEKYPNKAILFKLQPPEVNEEIPVTPQ